MRFTRVLLVVGLSIAVSGCHAFRSKNSSAPPGSPPPFGERIPPPPPDPIDFPSTGRASSAKSSGVLAGRVVLTYNQPLPKARIRVTPEDGSEQPVDAMADNDGYFVIQGLRPGKSYKLHATAKSGDRLLAGLVVARPPNARVVIGVAEDLAAADPGSSSPAAKPDSPGARIPEAAPRYLHEPDRGVAGDRIAPQPLDPVAPAGGPSPPLGNPIPPRSRPDRSIPWDRMAVEDGIARNDPPKVQIGGPVLPGPGRPDMPAAPHHPAAAVDASCRLTGNRLDDFVLKDLAGQPFQFSKYRGKLTLLDFWGSWCPPCTESLPYLVNLQRAYGPDGLQVIGVAYESGPLEEQVANVDYLRRRHNVNYKLLLGDSQQCPLRSDLRVRAFPTLILLDEQGEIIFRADGITQQTKTKLEAEIRRHVSQK